MVFMVKRLLYLGLVLFSLLNLGGALGELSYWSSSDNTTAYLNNSLINLYFVSNSVGVLSVYDGSAWDSLTEFNFGDGNYLHNTDYTVAVIENTSSRIVLNLSLSGAENYNVTLYEGLNFFIVENTTSLSSAYFKIMANPSGDLGSNYVYFPNVTMSFDHDVDSGGLTPYSHYFSFFNNDSSNSGFVVYNTEGRYVRAGEYDDFMVDWSSGFPTTFVVGGLAGLDVSTQTGDTAVNYTWDNWSWTGSAPTDYVIYYDLNEGTGSSVDNKEGTADYDGTITLGNWTHGKQHYGFNLSDTASYIRSDTVYNPASGVNVSWGMWVKRTGEFQNWYGLMLRNSSNGNMPINLATLANSNRDGVACYVYNSGASAGTGYVAVPLNEWTHVFCVYTGSSVELYINGELNTTGSVSAGFGEVRTDANGWFQVNADAGFMEVDEVRYYERALTANEVNALYGTGLPDTLNNVYSSSYGGYSTTDSFAELFANSSLAISTVSDELVNLGTNSNYTIRTINYETTNDWSLNNANNKLLTFCGDCYNPYINTNLINLTNNLGGNYVRVHDSCDFNALSSYEWNITGWWSFNETSGTVASNVYNNTMGFSSLDATGWTSGKYGNAYYSSGGSGATNYTDDEFDTDDFSVCFWLKDTDRSGVDQVLSKNYPNWHIRIETSNILYMSNTNAGGAGAVSAGEVGAEWSHHCYVYNSTTQNMTGYKNGEFIHSSTSLGVFNNTVSSQLTLDVSSPNSFTIDELYFFNRTLTSQEISNIYSNFADDCAYNKIAYTPSPNPVVGESTVCSYGCTETLNLLFYDEVTLDPVIAGFVVGINLTNNQYGLITDSTIYLSNIKLNIFPNYGILPYNSVHFNYYSNNSDYADRDYYLTNGSLTNVSSTLYLYLLSDGSEVTFTVLDAGNNYITDALVQALKYYESESAYRSVTMGYTDDYGKTVLNLDLYEWYRVTVTTDSGTVVKKIYIDSTTQTIYIDPDSVEDWFNYSDTFTTSFGWSNVTNYSWVYVIDDSGSMNNASLIVKDISLSGASSTVCDVSNFTAGSFYLFCYLGNDTTNKVYQVYAVATHADDYEEYIYNGYLVTGTSTSYPEAGLFISFIVILALGVGGAMVGGGAIVLLTLVALVVLKFANFLTISWSGVVIVGVISFALYMVRGDKN